MINYRSIQDLNRVIQDNLHKIPRGTEVIAGVHRSGHLAALLMGAQLNIPVISLRSLCETDWVYTGHRGFIEPEDQEVFLQTPRKVLVVEDASTSGTTLLKEQGRVAMSEKAARHKLTYLSIYPAVEDVSGVDMFFELVPSPRLWEWNWLNHGMMGRGCVSLEGILCRSHTDVEEYDETKMRRFAQSVAPLHKPTRVITDLVSTRLKQFQAATDRWLENHGIRVSNLHMAPFETRSEKWNVGTDRFKASIYMNLPDAQIFFEGNPDDAAKIFYKTNRPVFCVTTKTLYQVD